MHKIRKNDEVMVLTGKDRGKRGTVLRVLPNIVVLCPADQAEVHGALRAATHG